MSWSTSELRVRLAPLNRFKPSSKIFYWPFQGGTSFVDLLCFCSVLCLLCFVPSVYMCFVVTCWERADLLALVCGVLWVCHFPIGILGQVWYLIVSIPDLCNLTYFYLIQSVNTFNLHKATISFSTSDFGFVWFDSLRPINNFSVKQGRVFLGWTSTKLGLMCLAQGPQRSDAGETRTPRSRVEHWATALPIRFWYPDFVWFFTSQSTFYFSYVRMGLPGLNQY